ncbi:hypothetical protein [Streptosporangium sp. CA-115845]|uniref:hypothetical protein n=1 Tax=Streptosporangium sp. CA-115845 TaxID=3240071 RepID=UPI003D9426BA
MSGVIDDTADTPAAGDLEFPLLQVLAIISKSPAITPLACEDVAGQTFAPLHAFRRPRIRREGRADTHEAFPKLACAPICRRCLNS